MSLTNKKIVIIGASSGIGFALAKQLSTQGADVIAVSRHADSALAKKIGKKTVAYTLDLNNKDQVNGFIKQILHIDHLVFTAAPRIASQQLDALDFKLVAELFEVKVFSPLRLIQGLLPVLSKSGSILFTSGLLSRKAIAGTLAKAMGNGAIESLTKTLAKELAPIRVNTVSPGITDTDVYGKEGSKARVEFIEKTKRSSLLNHVANPQHLADGYQYLLENSAVTGTVLDIEGGALL
ncbi:SDR family NAD(P)-dependent oxidoreductase [Psychromonas hadalis]|uniref:SDR family NAD(P)-dependent oxidoreductase n=1 Tax=Psychromonas hadalis TaxID=211669 RepID=UPI0003B772A9|nr:SDR family oxidoreductase [Psychromonas hadalis]